MTSRDNLREAIKAGNLGDALVMAMSNAVELNITTWVTSEAKTSELANQEKPGESLRSQINLVEGKIKNEVGEQFVGDSTHKALKRFHLEQVLQGHKTIRDNIKSLQKLFQLLQAIQKHQGDQALSQEALLDLFSSTVSRKPEIKVVSPPATILEVESEEPEVDDDWDDSVLDIFTSVPNQETSEGISFKPNSETELVIEASGSDLLTPTPEMPATDLEIEDWEEAKAEFPAAIDSEWEDETWEDEDTEQSILSLDDLDIDPEEEEDWGDYLAEEETTLPQTLVGLEEEVEIELEAEATTEIQQVVENEEEEVFFATGTENVEAESTRVIQQVVENEEEEDSFATEAKANVFESESLTEDNDEDWGDWLEEEPSSIPEELVTTNSSTSSTETSYQTPIIPNLDSLDLEDNDDWEEEEQTINTFAVSYDEASVLDSEFEEDWDEFSIEELEPYSNLNVEESKEQQMPSETVNDDLNQDKRG
ncbi:MAG: hypothetical protein WA865_18015 [Spirulinaceae cyanobacterium]